MKKWLLISFGDRWIDFKGCLENSHVAVLKDNTVLGPINTLGGVCSCCEDRTINWTQPYEIYEVIDEDTD
jgi:hypothetical protein